MRALLDRLEHAWSLHDLPPPRIILEPGRSLGTGRGDPLSRRLREAGERERDVRRGRRRHVRQPAPAALRRAPHGAARQPRGRAAAGAYSVCGKHCESADVMIERALLPEPRRGDILAGSDGRVHARHELELQRCPAARGRARRGRRGSRHPQPRDGGRPPAVGAGVSEHEVLVGPTTSDPSAASASRRPTGSSAGSARRSRGSRSTFIPSTRRRACRESGRSRAMARRASSACAGCSRRTASSTTCTPRSCRTRSRLCA